MFSYKSFSSMWSWSAMTVLSAVTVVSVGLNIHEYKLGKASVLEMLIMFVSLIALSLMFQILLSLKKISQNYKDMKHCSIQSADKLTHIG